MRQRLGDLLVNVEVELQQADTADAQIGAHADDAHGKLATELGRRQNALGDRQAEREYLYLLAQHRRAQQVSALANEARRRR